MMNRIEIATQLAAGLAANPNFDIRAVTPTFLLKWSQNLLDAETKANNMKYWKDGEVDWMMIENEFIEKVKADENKIKLINV